MSDSNSIKRQAIVGGILGTVAILCSLATVFCSLAPVFAATSERWQIDDGEVTSYPIQINHTLFVAVEGRSIACPEDIAWACWTLKPGRIVSVGGGLPAIDQDDQMLELDRILIERQPTTDPGPER